MARPRKNKIAVSKIEVAKKEVIVSVSFGNAYHASASYSYRADGNKVKAGDFALVDSPATKITLVTIGTVNENPTEDDLAKATKSIAIYADCSSFFKQKEIEKKKKYLLDKLRSLKSTYDETIMFQVMASTLPEANKLYKELKKLEN